MPTLNILSSAAAGPSGFFAAFMQSGTPLFLGLGLVFYFFLIRPQMQQQKTQRAKIAGLKKGDQVVTAGGLVAKVVKVDEHYVDLEIATGVKVRAVRSTIGDVVTSGSAAAND